MKKHEYKSSGFTDAETFTLTETATIAGVNPKTLRNWLDRDLLSLKPQNRFGTLAWRKFIMNDVLRVTLIGMLKRFGVPIKKAKAVIDEIINKHSPLPKVIYIKYLGNDWEWTVSQPVDESIFITLNLKAVDAEMMDRYATLEKRY